MWLDSKAVNCPQKWGNFTAGKCTCVEPMPPPLGHLQKKLEPTEFEQST